MTWKDFKEFVELAGVTDDMEIDWIDCSSEPDDVRIDKEDNTFIVISRRQQRLLTLLSWN